MRKRSRYRPGPVDRDPLARLMPADGSLVMAQFDSALMSMMNGSNPSREDWRALADAINTVETLALGRDPKLIPHEVMPVVNRAIAGMVRVSRRFQDGKPMRLDADGLEAIRDVIDIYGQCCKGLTGHEMRKAQAETIMRVEAVSGKNDHERIAI